MMTGTKFPCQRHRSDSSVMTPALPGRIARLLFRVSAPCLITHELDALGARPDELDPCGIADLGETRVLGKKAVAGWIASESVISAALMMLGTFK